MCFGAESFIVPALISAAASTAGAYAQNRSSNAQIEGTAEAERQDRFKQAELQRQADLKLREGIQQFTPEQQTQQVQQATDVRTAAYQPTPAPVQAYQAATAAAPVEVKSDLERRMGDVFAKAKVNAANRGHLEAYGDASLGQAFGINRLREGIRQLGDTSASTSRILPYDIRNAQGKGQNWLVGSDIANSIGQLGSYYAAGRKPTGIGYGAASNPPGSGPY